MKRLIASLALLAFLFSTAAVAAESGKPAADNKSPRKEDRFDGKGDKKRRPKFEDFDKDKDGALNLEEFLARFPCGDQERFATIDADRDGKVTRDEARAFREARRTEKRRERFTACDRNNDEVLSFEEFAQCKPDSKDRRAGKQHPRKAPAA